jgi:ABC-2 type transport system ATP-binding protein
MRIDLTIKSPTRQHAIVFLGVSEGSAAPVFAMQHEANLAEGISQTSCTVPSLPLPRGRYFVWVAITDSTGADLTPWHPATSFDVHGSDLDPVLPGVMRLSPVYVGARWEASDPSMSQPASPSSVDR